MRVLAIDTALGTCSVAVLETETQGQPPIASVLRMERGHAEALMPQLADVLEAAGGLDAISRIAVTVGPGSFTGLRVGLACARALALGSGLTAVGVSTLAALAAPLLDGGDGATPVAAAIDARHGRVFFQCFAGDGRPLVSARLVEARDAARSIGGGPALVVGSGAGAVVGAAGDEAIRTAPERLHDTDPLWVARLGAACDPAASPPRPLYLKQADAHPQERGRIARR